MIKTFIRDYSIGALALEARERIEKGEDPGRWVHVVEMGSDTYLSTSIPEIEPGLTSKYYQLGEVACWV